MAIDAVAVIASIARQRLALAFGFCPACFRPMQVNINAPPSETGMLQVFRVDGCGRPDCAVATVRRELRFAS